MEIIEYEEQYLEDIKDLLVELEEYIISIDKDNLDVLGKDYREKMATFDLEDVNNHNGKCYLAIENKKVIGLIMGIIQEYNERDYLDYKCPKKGIITELVVGSNYRGNGIGKKLISKIEEYFKNQKCEYVAVEVFAYNEKAKEFYGKEGYNTRMLSNIKKL